MAIYGHIIALYRIFIAICRHTIAFYQIITIIIKITIFVSRAITKTFTTCIKVIKATVSKSFRRKSYQNGFPSISLCINEFS